MMPRICLTGLPAAGKTLVAELARTRLQVPIIDVASVLEHEIATSNKLTRDQIGPAFVAMFGRSAVTDAIDARVAGEREYILDAVRLPETIERLRATHGVVSIFVDASPTIRLARLQERLKREHRARGGVQRALRNYAAFDAEERDLRRIADAVIGNDGAQADLDSEVVKCLTRLVPNAELVA